ncbi:hypothetical protein DL764_004333 [Monosporascus ibericus]|uniref:Zinc finger ZPR1-type domain-containing protein n=1 Tax=Monosporascus ibericus TaxID=155417 RepID=A0A4Q4TCY4_9PEZI|nr:hypothetical protein DL764_004333 [Monosporascus ibericus]
MSAPEEQNNGPGPATVSSNEFFETIGKKVDHLAPTTNGTNGVLQDGDDDEKIVEEIESLCMNCRENGTTRMLLTAIPYFREVIVMSFSCDKCGFSNNEIQSAGTIQPKGSSYLLRLTAMQDFERTVVKSDTAVVKFIELDLEVPPGRGQLTNVEGLLSGIVDDLELGQEARKEQAPEVYEKVAQIIAKGRAMLAGDAFPFRLSVDDPAGNSWISPNMRDGIGKWEKRDYIRTQEQNEALGLSSSDPLSIDAAQTAPDDDITPDQVYAFPATCPGCMRPCTTNMKMVDIPHFKAVVLMSTVCEECGYRSNDVKTGGEIPELGKKIALRVESAQDLARDILKSESCSLECPELSLQVNPGTLGGRFTTVEGLLTQVRNDLHSQIFEASGEGGDSLAPDEKNQWTVFFSDLDAAIKGEKKFTIILTDPLASSYVQKAVDPDQDDPQMTTEDYQRTDEEEEDLGLKDMKVEGYEQDNNADAAEAK